MFGLLGSMKVLYIISPTGALSLSASVVHGGLLVLGIEGNSLMSTARMATNCRARLLNRTSSRLTGNWKRLTLCTADLNRAMVHMGNAHWNLDGHKRFEHDKDSHNHDV